MTTYDKLTISLVKHVMQQPKSLKEIIAKQLSWVVL